MANKFDGGTEIIISPINTRMNALAKLATASAADWFAETLKEKLTGPRSGQIYNVGGGREYQASAPGSITEQEYPAELTGDLRESIDFAVIGDNTRDAAAYAVGSYLPYAGILQDGSKYMIARMFLYKHMLEERDTLEAILGAPFYGETAKDVGGRPRATNSKNVSQRTSREDFNRRKKEIIDSYSEGIDERAVRASISRATSTSMQRANPEFKWGEVMRNIREGRPNYYDFRRK